MPRFAVFVRGSTASEGGQKPDPEMFKAMDAFNARMIEAGIMLGGEGLQPSSVDSRRIAFHDGKEPTVQSGPFPANEIVSGWWLLKVKDVEEVTRWVKECPMRPGDVLEVRRVADLEDFGDELSPELRENAKEMRKQVDKLAGGK